MIYCLQKKVRCRKSPFGGDKRRLCVCVDAMQLIWREQIQRNQRICAEGGASFHITNSWFAAAAPFGDLGFHTAHKCLIQKAALTGMTCELLLKRCCLFVLNHFQTKIKKFKKKKCAFYIIMLFFL